MSDKSKKIFEQLSADFECASKIYGSIEQNYMKIESIVPFKSLSQSCENCTISIQEPLGKEVIGIFHTYTNGCILPSETDRRVLKKLFPKRVAAILITEKREHSWIIHPFIMLKNQKMQMLESVII